MKRETKLLLEKAVNALILSIDHFNRPSDRGRVEAVLIFLDHSFEMLLKSAILHRGGRIFEKGSAHSLGFNTCVRRSLSKGTICFLSEEQALLLQTINSLRDATQHHLLNISEGQLYIQAQAGVTLFKDLLQQVFGKDLGVELPDRVLPISTQPPMDLAKLFENEVEEVRKLLRPGKRRRVEVESKAKALAILECAIKGDYNQPQPRELARICSAIRDGISWDQLFPGVACINITSTGYGPAIEFRLTKKAGIPIHLVAEGSPDAATVAVKPVNELSFYSLGRNDLSEKVGLGHNKTSAFIWYLKIKSDPECYRHIRIGKSSFDRYSPKAIDRLKEAMNQTTVDQVWKEYCRKGTKIK